MRTGARAGNLRERMVPFNADRCSLAQSQAGLKEKKKWSNNIQKSAHIQKLCFKYRTRADDKRDGFSIL